MAKHYGPEKILRSLKKIPFPRLRQRARKAKTTLIRPPQKLIKKLL